jgi:plasmid rolling circle replication initiator protein Rep
VRKNSPKLGKQKAVSHSVIASITAAESAPVPGAPVVAGLLQPKDAENLTKRARAKYFSYALAKELALCDSPLQASYYRTLACCSEMILQDGKLTSKYCGNRWCLVCSRIRTAKMLTKYEKHLQQMIDPHFVTLTIPNVSSANDHRDLKYTVTKLQQFCRRCFDRLRKYGIKYKGFRKIEISFNSDQNNYHPHLHFVIDCDIPGRDDQEKFKVIFDIWKVSKYPKQKLQELLRDYNAGKINIGAFKAELLRQAWLKEFKSARAIAQDIRAANAGSLKELFKYSAKIMTKRKGKKEKVIEMHQYKTKAGELREVQKVKYKQERSLEIHVQALDKIYCAIFGKRIIQPIGYTREEAAAFNEIAEGALDVEAQELAGAAVEDHLEFIWCAGDWRDKRSGARLTGFVPNLQDLQAAESFIFDSG